MADDKRSTFDKLTEAAGDFVKGAAEIVETALSAAESLEQQEPQKKSLQDLRLEEEQRRRYDK